MRTWLRYHCLYCQQPADYKTSTHISFTDWLVINKLNSNLTRAKRCFGKQNQKNQRANQSWNISQFEDWELIAQSRNEVHAVTNFQIETFTKQQSYTRHCLLKCWRNRFQCFLQMTLIITEVFNKVIFVSLFALTCTVTLLLHIPPHSSFHSRAVSFSVVS